MGDEKTRITKGTGLGLYIVKKIVDLYKYDIAVKNNSPQGTTFEIVL
jgi:signal transduction histidine kinase